MVPFTPCLFNHCLDDESRFAYDTYHSPRANRKAVQGMPEWVPICFAGKSSS